MKIDVIEMTEEELKKLTTIQMQLVRSAQKSKNELRVNLEKDIKLFEKLVLTNDLRNSPLLELKRAELEAEFSRKLDIIVEQLE